jgi:hypothetical protein
LAIGAARRGSYDAQMNVRAMSQQIASNATSAMGHHSNIEDCVQRRGHGSFAGTPSRSARETKVEVVDAPKCAAGPSRDCGSDL